MQNFTRKEFKRFMTCDQNLSCFILQFLLFLQKQFVSSFTSSSTFKICTLLFYCCLNLIPLMSVSLLFLQSEDFFGLRRLYVILGSSLFYKVNLTTTQMHFTVLWYLYLSWYRTV